MEKLEHIAVKEIRTNPFQPRKVFDQEKLEELAHSIKENGLIQPIIVRKSPIIGFELLAGERRFRASKIAGLEVVPAIIKELTDQEMMRQAILVPLDEEEQGFWLKKIKEDHLNVRTLENKISSKRKQKKKKFKETFLLEEEKRLKKILGTEVKIHSSSQHKGTIQISFSSLDEYQRIINSLK